MSNYFTRGWDYIRNADGSHWYSQFKKGQTSYLGGKDKLEVSLNNPVAAACSQIRANLLSKVQWYQEGADGERLTNTEWINLLNNPNALQSKQDFLIQYEWYRLAYGWTYQRPYGAVGVNVPDSVFNLKPNFIQFPQQMQSPIIFTKEDKDRFFEQKFNYEEPDHDTRSIEFKDVMMFFDIANGLNDDKTSIVTSPSRLSSVIKSVSNIDLGLDAENTIIQTNGRELFSQDTVSKGLGLQQPMDADDRRDIDNKLINNYNVSRGRRSVVTNKPVDWTNISMKLSDLGFVESGSNNANYICGMYEVPNELYKAFSKGATFENQKEALIGMYEKTIQPVADDLASTWTNYFELDQPIKASFDHLPVMQHTEQKKADKLLKVAMAYEKLTTAGLSAASIEELFRGQGIELNQE
jgi:hypothetical protein